MLVQVVRGCPVRNGLIDFFPPAIVSSQIAQEVGSVGFRFLVLGPRSVTSHAAVRGRDHFQAYVTTETKVASVQALLMLFYTICFLLVSLKKTAMFFPQTTPTSHGRLPTLSS